jgi:uncharacterized protein YbjT (DUF2867 family)
MSMIYRLLGWVMPHYRGKWEIEKLLRYSPLETVILLPSNFYQNDALFQHSIEQGRYPQPIGRWPVNRVDCRDIGLAGARALRFEIPAGIYTLTGPQSLTGQQTAAIWSEALGRPISYTGNDLSAWRELVQPHFSAQEIDDFASTYSQIQRFGAPAMPWDHRQTQRALGRPPITYTDYVADQIAQWQQTDSVTPKF